VKQEVRAACNKRVRNATDAQKEQITDLTTDKKSRINEPSSLPELAKEMKVHWNISLCLYI